MIASSAVRWRNSSCARVSSARCDRAFVFFIRYIFRDIGCTKKAPVVGGDFLARPTTGAQEYVHALIAQTNGQDELHLILQNCIKYNRRQKFSQNIGEQRRQSDRREILIAAAHPPFGLTA